MICPPISGAFCTRYSLNGKVVLIRSDAVVCVRLDLCDYETLDLPLVPTRAVLEALQEVMKMDPTPASASGSSIAGLTFRISRKGILLKVDFTGPDVFGYSAEELNSGSFPLSRLLAPEDVKYTTDTLLKLMTEGSGFRFRHRIRTRQGEVRWIITSGRFLFTDTGKYIGTEGVLVEITDLVNHETALAEAEARYRSLIDVLVVGVIVYSDRILLANAQAALILGFDQETLRDSSPAGIEQMLTHFSAEINSSTAASAPYSFKRPDGSIRLITGSAEAVLFRGERVRQVAFRDVTEESTSEQLRITQAEILSHIATRHSTKSVLEEICTTYERLNPETYCTVSIIERGMLGITYAPSLPAEFSQQFSGMEIGPKAGSCGTAAFTGESVVVEEIATDPLWEQYISVIQPFGLASCWSIPVKSAGKVVATLGIYKMKPAKPSANEWASALQFNHLTAVAIEHGRAIDALRYEATHDPLTGSLNRTEFQRELEHALKSKPDGAMFAVASVDLDNFRLINETWGHSTGDQVLRTIATRLATITGPDGGLSRVSGDEFLLFTSIESEQAVSRFASAIQATVGLPILTARNDFRLDARIGIATSDVDDSSAEELMRNADSALHVSKISRKSSYSQYTTEFRERSSRQLNIINELRTALESNMISIALQPEVDLETGRVFGFEVLARWIHPELGSVPPVEFIPVAEQSGLIIQLGRHVITLAFQVHQDWKQELVDGSILMAINVSTHQLMSPEFVSTISQLAEEYSVESSLICFEITESAVLDDPEAAISVISQLKAMGFRLAIDDFGTGYSSLSQLSRITTDFVKLDRSFVSELGLSIESLAITEAVLGISKVLDLTIIAEGVETEQQREILLSLGITFGQGYLFSKPLSKESAFERLISDSKPITG